jgi:Glycosyl hydrolases family 18
MAALVVVVAACGSPVTPSAGLGGSSSADPSSVLASASASAGLSSASPVPAPGHELYGFVPYWEMDDTIAAHLAATPLTTVGLFSVSNTSKGAINTTQPGYMLITGDIGAAMISAAHGRGTRVELVFTSFGAARNTTFFGRPSLQDATIASLVALVGTLGVDGVDVDVEGLDIGLTEAYGSFVGRLRAALVAADAGDTVSVATGAGPTGAAMAGAAVGSGADRVFLMAYDYRTAGSEPGAVSPIIRTDNGRSITWSLDLYAATAVPAQRLLLGLPLYGMSWPVAAPVVGAPSSGNGTAWILRRHLDVLTSSAVPTNDPLEGVDVYFVGSDGSFAPPSPSPSATPAPLPSGTTWSAVYVDSAATLERKLGLGESRGYAGAGFWATGYERGLPAYTHLMDRFVAGDVAAS